VQEAVTRTLEHHSTQQLSAFVKKEEPFSAAFSSFAPSRPSSPSPLGLLSSFSSGAPTVRTLPLSSFPTDVLHENKPPHQPPTLSLPFSTEPTEIALPTVIGQLLTTYIVAESTQGLVLIDQHAAHERILYERFATATYEPIELLFPPTITLSATDCTVLAEYVELLEQTGIHLTIMGETQIIITAVAAPLKNVDMRECITQIVGIITEHHHLDHEQVTTIIKEKVRAQMACKAAVKAGDILSIEHMNALIVQLHETKNRYTCPHGRPTSWHISQYEIEKKFKRIK
jgi:DNA mismatch repair ATPase MutL